MNKTALPQRSIMENLARSEIIRDNPIGNGLDEFRSIWAINALQQLNALDLDALDQLDKQRLRNTIRAFLKARRTSLPPTFYPPHIVVLSDATRPVVTRALALGR